MTTVGGKVACLERLAPFRAEARISRDREWYDSGMKIPKTDKERRELIKRLAKSGRPEDIKRGTGKIPDEFWTMPRPKDPEGLLLKALLEDRREGR